MTAEQLIAYHLAAERSAPLAKAHALARGIAATGGQALFVGGMVRDAALAQAPSDLDIEVYGLSVEQLEQFLRKNFAVDLVGRSFGVFKLKGTAIDVSLPRRESSTGRGHRDFEVLGDPHMSPDEAARRRDFTINAIAWNPLERKLIDPLQGLRDLTAKCLRHCSPQFTEDPLRVLRGMQFISRFELQAAPETLELCKTLDQANLPEERIFEEWKKLILKGRQISAGLTFLAQTAWLRHYPELAALIGCEQEPKWHPEGDVWTHTGHCMDAFAKQRTGNPNEDLIVGFGVLCHDMGKPETSFKDEKGRIRSPKHDSVGVEIAERFLSRLTRQKRLIDAVLPLVREHMRPHDLFRAKASASAVRKLAQRVGRIDRLVRVANADRAGRPPLPAEDDGASQWLLDQAEQLKLADSAPKPIVQGRHLITLGAKPGKHFSKILKSCFDAQLDGDFEDESGGLAYARALLEKE